MSPYSSIYKVASQVHLRKNGSLTPFLQKSLFRVSITFVIIEPRVADNRLDRVRTIRHGLGVPLRRRQSTANRLAASQPSALRSAGGSSTRLGGRRRPRGAGHAVRRRRGRRRRADPIDVRAIVMPRRRAEAHGRRSAFVFGRLYQSIFIGHRIPVMRNCFE